MAILNYTTTVESYKTIAEIENILVKHKATSILKNYEGQSVSSMSFIIETSNGPVPIKMPVKVNSCYEILKKEKQAGNKSVKVTMEQAERVAWRILKDWLKAQMSLLDIEMVKMEEIFLPYIEIGTGQTIFQKLEKQQFFLEDEKYDKE